MLSSLRFYEMYTACSLHFKGKYDYFKYGGKTRVTPAGFLKAKGRVFFDRWASRFHNEDQALEFLAANFKHDCKWVGDLKDSHRVEFRKYKNGMCHFFKEDVIKYRNIDPIEECFSGSKDAWNYLIIFDHAYKGEVFKRYAKRYSDSILWENLENELNKFRPFLIHCYDIKDEGFLFNLRKIYASNKN